MCNFKKQRRCVSTLLAFSILAFFLSACGNGKIENGSSQNSVSQLFQSENISDVSEEVEGTGVLSTDSSENHIDFSDTSSSENSDDVSETNSDGVSENNSDDVSENNSDDVSDENNSTNFTDESKNETESSFEAVSEVTSEVASDFSEAVSEELSSSGFSSEDTNESEYEVSKDPNEPLTPIPTLEADSIDSYFDKSVFIGYSIMMHFGKYVNQWRMDVDSSIMGESKFCAGVGMSFTMNNTTSPNKPDNALPKYQGQSYNFEDLPNATDSDTMFVGLMVYSETKRSTVDNCVNYAVEVSVEGIQSIIDANPDVNVVVLSGTYNTGLYRTEEISPQRANNDNVREYNSRVLEYCNANGIDFIDVSTPLLDGRGYMPREYSSDKDYHISKEPFKIWIHILRNYARAKLNGTWHNIEEMPPLVQS